MPKVSTVKLRICLKTIHFLLFLYVQAENQLESVFLECANSGRVSWVLTRQSLMLSVHFCVCIEAGCGR